MQSTTEVTATPEVHELLEQLQRSAPALTRILRRIERAEQSGAIDTVLDLAETVHAARVSMSDTMIARMADGLRTVAELGDLLMSSGLAERAPALVNATVEAKHAAAADTGHVGPLSLLMAPREPELQFMLKFMLAMGRRLPKAMQE